jgi:hypothetical protein
MVVVYRRMTSFSSNIPRENIFILVPLLQHYLIKYVSDLRQVSGFSVGSRVSSINKTDRHDITEILLKVKPTYIYIYIYIYLENYFFT